MNLRLLLLPLLLGLACQSPDPSAQSPYRHWQVYRGTPDANQYSALTLIDTQNVHQLVPAWTYHTGDAARRSSIQCNPIIVDGIAYLTSPNLKVIALDAATGEERWTFQPAAENRIAGVNRGVTFWGQDTEARIFVTAGHELLALDAETGQLITTFGDSGRIDLRLGLDYPPEQLSLSVTSPGIIFEDLLIMGSSTGEGWQASPGHVRAYDTRTGDLRWTFRTIPRPGEPGSETWAFEPDGWYGGVNAWGGLSLDTARGWVFLATGSPTYDFYGANRQGKNLYGNCVVAVDARNGEHIWHYQTVHHDLWDYDLPCAPNLIEVEHDGKRVEAVAQPTKMGYVLLLDRESGEPLWPLEEGPVPPSTVPGEIAWPTQPLPETGWFMRREVTRAALDSLPEPLRSRALTSFDSLRYEGPFTPPGLNQHTLQWPCTWGGASWGGASYHAPSQTLFVNAHEIGSITRLKPVSLAAAPQQADDRPQASLARGKQFYQLNCSGCHGLARKGVPPAYPALIGLEARYDEANLGQLIRQGKGNMPAYPQFQGEDLEALTRYLLRAPDSTAEEPGAGKQVFVIEGYDKWLHPSGVPLSPLPFGSLNALDMRTGQLKWKVPIGEIAALQGSGLPPTGDRSFGGCISTAGGLVFIGAAVDEKIRAFHYRTGEQLWAAPLPAGGYATPATFMLDGRQYLLIAAGGGGRGGTASGDAYVCFVLPEK